MKKKIKGIHLIVTEGLESAINEEIYLLEDVLKNSDDFNITIDLSIENLNQVCHIKLVTDKIYNITKKEKDMYESINESFRILRYCINKEKGKKISSKKYNKKMYLEEEIEDIDEEDIDE